MNILRVQFIRLFIETYEHPKVCYDLKMNDEEREIGGEAPLVSSGSTDDAETQNIEVFGRRDSHKVATPSLLPDLKPFTHTVPEASLLMRDRDCKYHSERKVQRLCQSGAIECYRLQTTRNSKPVTEWLVSGPSLLRYIEDNEEKINRGENPLTSVATPAKEGHVHGDANQESAVENLPDDSFILATPDQPCDASKNDEEKKSVEHDSDDNMPPVATPVYRTSEVDILIEKAELRAKLEMQEGTIRDLREDKSYLRKLVEEHRTNEKKLQADMKTLAEASVDKTLSTLQNIALKGRLDPPNPNEGKITPTTNPQGAGSYPHQDNTPGGV